MYKGARNCIKFTGFMCVTHLTFNKTKPHDHKVFFHVIISHLFYCHDTSSENNTDNLY